MNPPLTIQYKFFTIPVKEPSEAETELNRFLGSNRLITVHREFVSHGENSCREVLSPEDFSIYARIRDWRKEKANQEGVQLYTIFTNEQIAKMMENRITSKNKLKEIEGIGDARVEKYGNDVLNILKEEMAKQDENKSERTEQ